MTFSPRSPSKRSACGAALASLIACWLSIAGTTRALAEKQEKKVDLSSEFEKCRLLGDDQARLTCLKALLPKEPDDAATPAGIDSWPLVRTPNPRGGPDAVSVMRTADTTRSDPDIAGLMIRCAERPGLETVLALVRPVPPRSKRDVAVTVGTSEVVLHAEVASAGTALVLPVETSTFTKGPWRDMKEFAVTIRDPDGEIRGVIPLGGIAPAIAKLSANCPSG